MAKRRHGAPNQATGPGRPAKPRPAEATIEPSPEAAAARDASGHLVLKPADPTTELVGRSSGAFGGFWNRYRGYLARLPQAIDDLSLELGLDVLRRMMNDPQISASMHTLVYQAISRGLRAKPRYDDPAHPLYKAGVEMYDFISYNLDYCSQNLDRYERGMGDTLADMGVAMLGFGNNAAELVFDIKTLGQFSGKMCLSGIKPKAPEVYAHVVDPYGNLVGLACYTGAGLQEGGSLSSNVPVPVLVSPLSASLSAGNWEVPAEQLPQGWEVIPIGKFLVFTHRSRHGDPRGMSVLRSAYNAWYLLMTLWPEYHKYLVQFASPSVKGILPEKCPDTYDPETGKYVKALDELQAILEDFQNGGIIVARNGTEIELLRSDGEGHAFTSAIETLNHQMIKGILHSILATETANNNTRAASTVHKDVSDLAGRQIRMSMCSAVRRQLFRRLVYMNFGGAAADLLTPYATMGDITPEDRAAMISSYSQAGLVLTPTQERFVAYELEIEPPSPEEMEMKKKKMATEAEPKPAALPGAGTGTKPGAGSKPGTKPGGSSSGGK